MQSLTEYPPQLGQVNCPSPAHLPSSPAAEASGATYNSTDARRKERNNDWRQWSWDIFVCAEGRRNNKSSLVKLYCWVGQSGVPYYNSNQCNKMEYGASESSLLFFVILSNGGLRVPDLLLLIPTDSLRGDDAERPLGWALPTHRGPLTRPGHKATLNIMMKHEAEAIKGGRPMSVDLSL